MCTCDRRSQFARSDAQSNRRSTNQLLEIFQAFKSAFLRFGPAGPSCGGVFGVTVDTDAGSKDEGVSP